MRILKFFFFCLAVSFAATGAFAAFNSDYTGAAGAQFLKLGPGARAYGLAQAYASAADDVTAIYWNPAGLARMEGHEASFTHTAMFEDINYQWAAYGFKSKYGVFAFGLQYLSYGDLDRMDTSGVKIGSMSPYDAAFSAAFARSGVLGSKIDLGLSLKYIYSKITEKAQAFAVDASLKSSLSEKISVSAGFKNLGTELKYKSYGDPLPFSAELGALYKAGRDISISAQLYAPNDSSAWLATGVEYAKKIGKNSSVALRAGYNNLNEDVGGSKGFALGMGFNYSRYKFDYSYNPMGDLGSVSRFAMSAKF